MFYSYKVLSGDCKIVWLVLSEHRLALVKSLVASIYTGSPSPYSTFAYVKDMIPVHWFSGRLDWAGVHFVKLDMLDLF